MNRAPCEIFDEWLERLPRRTLSPRMQRHLESCPRCRAELERLAPVAATLRGLEPRELDPAALSRITRRLREESLRRENRLLAAQLSLIGLLCLPLVILVNWAWGILGFRFLATYVSPTLAHAYIITFTLAATAGASLSYGAIPLLAGWLRGPAQGGSGS
jgi:predicted anti-sigma-YlaC factor YlaD